MKELGITRISQGQRFKTTAYEALLEETGSPTSRSPIWVTTYPTCRS